MTNLWLPPMNASDAMTKNVVSTLCGLWQGSEILTQFVSENTDSRCGEDSSRADQANQRQGEAR